MGLVKKITLDSGILYIWHITEALEELISSIELSEYSQQRLAKMKAENHQRAFLAVRQVLGHVNIQDVDLVYDSNGRPSLANGQFISISHSFDYAVVAISCENIGVDIELKRDKIIRLSTKFCTEMELSDAPQDLEEQLDYFTEIWSVKEALFKMCNSRSLSFAQDMSVDLIEKKAKVRQEDFQCAFNYQTFRLDKYVLVVSY